MNVKQKSNLLILAPMSFRPKPRRGEAEKSIQKPPAYYPRYSKFSIRHSIFSPIIDRLTLAEYSVDECNEVFIRRWRDDLGNRDLVKPLMAKAIALTTSQRVETGTIEMWVSKCKKKSTWAAIIGAVGLLKKPASDILRLPRDSSNRSQ